tara:strand:- start:50689 stop:51249 length:561 start_codon:yes stop_codon:yes gene_type:complete
MFFKPKAEEALMRKVAKGDSKAFRQLALIYQKPLHKFCLTFMNGSNIYVDDVVQQVLITWWQKSPMWSPLKGSLRAWVFTIAANKCKDYLKRLNHNMDVLDDNHVDNSEGADNHMQGFYQNAVLLESLSKLSIKQRDVIWLFYFEELKQSEVAEKMKISVKAVESNLQRSRSKLKIILNHQKEDLL